MSWGRTSLAYLVAAAVMLRWAPHYGAAVIVVAGGLMVVSLLIYATQQRRYRRAALGVQSEQLTVSAGPVVGLTLSTVALGVAGLVFVAADMT